MKEKTEEEKESERERSSEEGRNKIHLYFGKTLIVNTDKKKLSVTLH